MGLSKFIKNLTKDVQKVPFEPSIFNHPLALKTDWSPQAGGGANFKTRTLKKLSTTKLRYETSTFGKVLAGIFLIFPLIFIVIGATTLINQSLFFGILFISIPLLFIAVGVFIFKKMSTTLTFDKSAGYYFRGKNTSVSSLNQQEDKNTLKLTTIKALQIIAERVRSKNSSYTSYEINLVFQDGSRHNVIDHGIRSTIEKDAVTLSDFLGVPVWNKMSSTSYIPKTITTSTTSAVYDSVNHYDTPAASYEEPTHSGADSRNLDEPYDSTKPRAL